MLAISSVLIVDDEEPTRRTLKDVFKSAGVGHIGEAATAEDAMELLALEPYSLIVCDYFLPAMNGLVFVGKLRLKKDWTPVLLISGVPDKAEIVQAAAKLKAEFLAKPFTISQLMSVIERLE
ncbi:MAG: response regulator [Verrucomicrobiae bacterium]|nr:response regulator [Verrucomicrobiae bacterium]